MKFFEAFFFLVFISSVLSDGASLLKPCKVRDIECLSKSTAQFLERTCNGFPDYDIKAIEPLLITSFEHKLTDSGSVVLLFKNLSITGLSNENISDFQMDKVTKSVVLKLNVNLNINSDLTIVALNKHDENGNKKTFSGKYSANATILVTAKYGYDLITDSKNIQHFDVGPESITCEITGEPNVSLDDEFRKTLDNDPLVKNWRKTHRNLGELKNTAICKIVEEAYVTVIHNLRAVAKILPTTAFFQDI